MYCLKCGKELAPDAAYCHNCGAKVGEPAPVGRKDEWDWERRWRRDRGTRDGWWGAVNAIAVLVIIGLTISRYPDVFFLIGRYVESWGTHGFPVLPGYALGQVIIYFFTISGIWGLVSAGLRFAFTYSISRPLRDVVGALFALYIANSFSQFYAGAIRGTGLVLAVFAGFAVLIIASALITYYIPRRVRPMGT